jgi:hypothetical protein
VNAIIHSGDVVGQYCNLPNAYRDPTFSFDPVAEKDLAGLKKKYL